MGWYLWAIGLAVLALHAAWLRWMRKRARRTASLRRATSTPADPTYSYVTSSWTSDPAKGNGASSTATATSLPSSSRMEPGLTPRHIPDNLTLLDPTTWESTSPGFWHKSPTPAAPEAGLPAGGEAASREGP